MVSISGLHLLIMAHTRFYTCGFVWQFVSLGWTDSAVFGNQSWKLCIDRWIDWAFTAILCFGLSSGSPSKSSFAGPIHMFCHVMPKFHFFSWSSDFPFPVFLRSANLGCPVKSYVLLMVKLKTSPMNIAKKKGLFWNVIKSWNMSIPFSALFALDHQHMSHATAVSSQIPLPSWAITSPIIIKQPWFIKYIKYISDIW
jgi:hypothetical protein